MLASPPPPGPTMFRVGAVLQLKADTEAAAAAIRGENERRAVESARQEARQEREKGRLTAKGLNPYKVGGAFLRRLAAQQPTAAAARHVQASSVPRDRSMTRTRAPRRSERRTWPERARREISFRRTGEHGGFFRFQIARNLLTSPRGGGGGRDQSAAMCLSAAMYLNSARLAASPRRQREPPSVMSQIGSRRVG